MFLKQMSLHELTVDSVQLTVKVSALPTILIICVSKYYNCQLSTFNCQLKSNHICYILK